MATCATLHDAEPRLVVKLQYRQGYDHVTTTDLDKLLEDIRHGVDGFVCTLQATVGKYPPPESLLKSAVKYVRGESSTDYCKTAKGSSLTHTLLVEVLTNAESVPTHVLDLIHDKVKCYILKGSSDQEIISWVGVNQVIRPSKVVETTKSFVVRVQYPQCCVPVKQDDLNAILCGIQQTEGLWNYECTLVASVSDSEILSSGSQDVSEKYCKTAPIYAGEKKDKLTEAEFSPTILIEFLYTVKPANDSIDKIETEVILLVKTHIIPKKCEQRLRVKLFHLNTSTTS